MTRYKSVLYFSKEYFETRASPPVLLTTEREDSDDTPTVQNELPSLSTVTCFSFHTFCKFLKYWTCLLIFTVKTPTRCNSLSTFSLFLILNEAQHVSGDTSPIIRTLKLHKQPLGFAYVEGCRMRGCIRTFSYAT